jgi:hypothetical protein
VKYKEGDRVRIRSKEWIDAQEKDKDGDISIGARVFLKSMFQYAGREAVIIKAVNDDSYEIDIDSGEAYWSLQMFDLDYNPADGPLSAGDAIIAMVRDRETLVDEDGRAHRWDWDNFLCDLGGNHWVDFYEFNNLYRRPAKRKRAMTRWEMLNWANSEASRGWLVRSEIRGDWYLPQYFKYETAIAQYQRARLLPDLSGVDESTIQGFEVEV